MAAGLKAERGEDSQIDLSSGASILIYSRIRSPVVLSSRIDVRGERTWNYPVRGGDHSRYRRAPFRFQGATDR
jgi:hypothetical protein